MPRRILIPALGMFLALASSTLAQTPQPAAKASVGDAVRGRQVYEAVGCWQCHGYVGQGGQGARLAPKPLPLQAFAAYTRSPAQEMPAYPKAVLSARDIVDIHAYMSSIPEGRPASAIKLLSPP